MHTPHRTVSEDTAPPQYSPYESADDTTALIWKLLQDALNRAAAVATLSTAFNSESEGPATTLAAAFSSLPPSDGTTLSKYYDTFAAVSAEDANDTLLGFSRTFPYVTLSHGESYSLLSFIFGFGKESISSFLLLFFVYMYKVIFFSFLIFLFKV